MGSTGFHVWHAFRLGERRFDSLLKTIPASYAPMAVEALWILDPTLLESLVKGLADTPDIAWAAVADETGIIAEAGTRPQRREKEVAIPLIREVRGKEVELGKLLVSGDSAAILRSALESMALETPVSLGSLLLLSIVVYFYLQRDVGRPLAIAARGISAFRPDASWVPLQPHRRKGDEIDRLIASWNDLGARLVESHAGQEKAKASLESALRERELLIQELFHRTQNNLQVLLSLIYLEGKGGTSGESAVLASLESRIVSMAIAHRLLYESRDLSSLDLAEYIRRRVAHSEEGHAVDGTKIETRLELEPILTTVDNAIPFGIAAGDLLDTVWSHAFPGRERGAILLRLQRLDEARARFSIEDDGEGDREAVVASSKGLDLVSSLVAVQLHGSLRTYSSELGGFGVSIDFEYKLYERRV
jgi:two-component sensor histidine kinase